MSTFYLLPSRPMLGERFASWLESTLPGLTWPSGSWADLAEALASLAASRPDVFLVYRDELADECDAAGSLAEGFGAEPGDVVVELDPGRTPPRHWRLER